MNTQINIAELSQRVHSANQKWWHDIETGAPIKRNIGELLMLTITEIAEAVEGIRKDLRDDHLPNRKMEEVEIADAFIRMLDINGGFGIGVTNPSKPPMFKLESSQNKAEQLLMVCDSITLCWYYRDTPRPVKKCIEGVFGAIIEYCEIHKLDLMGAFEEKMKYNETRADHSHEARRAANGKKF